MQIVEETSIKSTEHDQSSTHNKARMPSPRFWEGLHNVYSLPFALLKIELVQVNNVLFVPTSQDVQISIMSSCRMTPSSRRYTFSGVYLCAGDHLIDVHWIFKELSQVEDVQFIHMHIFAVAATECNDLCVRESRHCMESLGGIVIKALDLGFIPAVGIKIKTPNVSQVRISLSSNNDHIVFDQA